MWSSSSSVNDDGLAPRRTLSGLMIGDGDGEDEGDIGSSLTPRMSADLMPESPSISRYPLTTTQSLPYRPRNTSPLARGHLRSRSSASPMTAPPMTRAHSSPVVDTAGRILMSTSSNRPLSPLDSYRRYRSPSRRSPDEMSGCAPGNSLAGIGEATSEDVELEITPRGGDQATSYTSPPLPFNGSNSFPRRYRPSSPLSHAIHASTPPPRPTSPFLGLNRFNEGYPSSSGNSVFFSSNSSVPSTPTSTRSRSPSISSLETIPDSPDAEEAALEAERIASLKAAAEAAEGRASSSAGSAALRRSSMEVSGSGRPKLGSLGSGGGSFNSRDNRKRWSVCGAERRGDLDLETIWED